MRVNANSEIHKKKRDPFKTMIRITLILAAALVVLVGIKLACEALIDGDLAAKKKLTEENNIIGRAQFQQQLEAAIAAQTGESIVGDDGEPVQKNQWSRQLGGQTWMVQDEGYAKLENTSTVSIDRGALIKGGLLLVNQWHALPPEFSDADLINVGRNSGAQIQVQDYSVQLFDPAYDALFSMIKDAKEQKLESYIVREAYRSNETQTKLFEDKMQALSDKYSGDILIEQAKKDVNYPGTSEYQTGLSFRMALYSKTDASLKDLKFQETEQGKWFTENAWKYGVIFRFPTLDFPTPEWEDKSYKTGMSQSFTANIYRYVGKPHATAMRAMNMCLEEYVEYLISNPHLTVYRDGLLIYEIYRVPDTGDGYMELPKPNQAIDYIASLDNMGGVVLAYTYNN